MSIDVEKFLEGSKNEFKIKSLDEGLDILSNKELLLIMFISGRLLLKRIFKKGAK